MKKPVYIIADNIVSPLGFDSRSNWEALLQDRSGVKPISVPGTPLTEIYASRLADEHLRTAFAEVASPMAYTRLEQMYILSIRNAAQQCDVDLRSERTLFVFSTTKGNIDLLAQRPSDPALASRLRLATMARHVTKFFGNPQEPVVVSNACISGVSALLVGGYYLREGLFDHVIVTGGDIISAFTLSGFQSLQALSSSTCKPFDHSRDGINLGEACATVVLAATRQSPTDIEVKRGATTNDANHISGPSRSGDGLAQAITQALRYSEVSAEEIGYVSAHGTATRYNDEMEARALHTTGLAEVPVNSLKASFGHTLGAAGVLETILSAWSLRQQLLLPSKGYEAHGVSLPLNVLRQRTRAHLRYCLKTASGFGGCNAALILANHY